MKLNPGTALLGSATMLSLFAGASHSSPTRLAGQAGAHPDQGTTARMVRQQAMAESGIRSASGNRLDVTARELARLPTDRLTATRPSAGDATSMGSMVMDAAPVVVTGPTNQDPAVGGSWTDYAFTMPNAPAAAGTASSTGAVHTVQLSNGKVLVMGGSGNQWQNLQAGRFTTWLWDPDLPDQTKAWKLIPTPYDMFCAGHAVLPDGNVLIAGGTTAYPQYDANGNLLKDWQGSKQAYVYDVKAEAYVQTGAMANARWYPTLVSTGDGTQVVVSGLDDQSQKLGVVSHYTDTVEQYDPATKTWSTLPPMDFTTGDPSQKTAAAGTNQTRTFGYYPGLVLLQNGQLFYSGASNGDNGLQTGVWDWRTGGFTGFGMLPQPYQRNAAATVLLPPAQDQKVMVMGGGDYQMPAIADTEIIDLKSGTGTWTKGPALSASKMYVGAVVLPDYTVFETNGASQFRAGGVHTAEIYDPSANAFRVMNSPAVDRLYHSEAFLRPDGTVITLGSQPLDGTFQLAISVYRPPYLYKGARPAVTGGPATFDYSGAATGPFTITTAPGTTVGRASLLRPSATTHSTDPDQRLIDLKVARAADGSYTLTAPTNSNIAPPGQYMLFVTDSTGVPSIARWVSIGAAPTAAPAPARSLTLSSTMTSWEATFTATSSVAAAGQDIVLQRLDAGTWTDATNKPTDANGVSRMIWGGGSTTQFRVRLPASGTTPETVSPTVTVVYGPGTTTPATPAPTLTLSATMANWVARFTASSSVAAAGQDIALEQLQGTVWTKLTNQPTTATGTSTMVWGGGGTAQFRAHLPATASQPDAVSPAVTVTYGP